MSVRRVFVYGTCMRGECRHHAVQGCKFIGERDVPGMLFDTGYGYPAALFDPQCPVNVHGELYELACNHDAQFLQQMDKVEGVDFGLFDRRELHVKNESFYAYEAGVELRRQIKDHQKIQSGHWKKRAG